MIVNLRSVFLCSKPVLPYMIKQYDINVDCILPSTVDTPTNRRNFPKADSSKWVRLEDIAKVILFLISDDSSVISGAAVPVYGKA